MFCTKTVRCVLIALLVVTLQSMSRAHGDDLVLEYSFGRPHISSFERDSRRYHSLFLKGAPATGMPGQPALPAKGAYILLPFGSDVETIRVESSHETLFGNGYNVEPCGYPAMLSAERDSLSFPEPDPDVYSSHEKFPASYHDLVCIQSIRGFVVLVLKLHPVRFVGANGELYLSENLTVRISTTSSANQSSTFRGLPRDAEEVRTLVDNPDVVGTYPINSQLPENAFTMLIVTRNYLVPVFTQLEEYHDSTGMGTEIRTIESDIGSFDPTSIRDYIRERYLNDGIEYVLIGGDDDVISAVDLYVRAWYTEEEQMPGDIYFSCLDGTYNYDGDDRWGEPDDGEGGGDVDLLSEVHVGRASVSDVAEAQRFVNKTIQYLQSDGSPFLRKVLLTGENLGYPDKKLYGGYALDLLVDGSNNDGYTTAGFPSGIYAIDRLYDKDWPGGDWPASEAVSRINDGQHLISHLGHSNYEYSLKLYMSQLDQLTNSDLCFMYNEGCFAGWFDDQECWAEQITVKTDHGAFAAIMNARYGWVEGWLDTDRSDGPSNRFNREFWDAVFNPDENMPELGRANSDSRHDNLWRINLGANRWVAYQLILFGDPSVSLKKPASLAFSFPGGLPEVAVPGELTTLVLEITGLNGGEVVPGSEVMHYSIDSGEYQTVQLTQADLDTYESTLPPLDCGQTVEYFFSAEETSFGEYFDCGPENPHSTTAALEVVSLFQDDFETDQGWAASGGLWQRGIPTGQGGIHTSPDPASGCNGPCVYGYNLDGDYENNLPEQHLTSPVIDCSGFHNVRLRFSRWLGVEQSDFDHASVRVSADGETWDTVWKNVSAVVDTCWTEMEYDISAVADHQPAVRLRWTIGPTNDSMVYCGWNIDDVRLISYACAEFTCGDANTSGAVDIDDVVHLVNYIFAGGPEPVPYSFGDTDCSGAIDIDDAVYLITYIFSGGFEPCDLDGDAVPDC